MSAASTLATARAAAIAVLLGLVTAPAVSAQAAAPDAGTALYLSACATCHGVDGRGAPRERTGLDLSLPDFSDCAFATVEPDQDWLAIAHDGGPARAFDRRMPAFGHALTNADLQAIIGHLRGFCRDGSWPRGELNLPRPLVTEKAFPENEAVLTTAVAAGGPGAVTNTFTYEQRLGVRSQFEVSVPLAASHGDGGAWQRGLGDLAVAMKTVLIHSLARGHILSAGSEVVFPTATRELGDGVMTFEPFLAFGQILPRDGFLHLHAGVELPSDTQRVSREAFWRAAIGKTFTPTSFGRAWSPMLEVLGARDLVTGASVEWDLVPQVEVTLSRRQHITMNGGVRIPVAARTGRHPQVLAYFLWDWFDGGLLGGW